MIELLIALTITSILILGTAQLTLHSIHLKRKSDCLVRAAELMADQLEHFKSLSYDCTDLEENEVEETFKDARLNHVFFREWTIQSDSPTLKRIEISCFAKNHPRKRARTALLLSKALGF